MKPSDIFIKHDVLLVHCAGFVPGFGSEETNIPDPIERLRKVRSEMPEVSCSTVGFSDWWMKGEQGECANFTGPLGLILNPLSFECITHTNPTDSGTVPGNGHRLHANGKNSPSDLCSAITKRAKDDYNEICVREYKILGLFMAPPIRFPNKKYEIQDVVKCFDSMPWYVLSGCKLHRLSKDLLKSRPVGVADVYSA